MTKPDGEPYDADRQLQAAHSALADDVAASLDVETGLADALTRTRTDDEETL